MTRGTVIWRYLLLTWIAVSALCTGFLARVPWSNGLCASYALAMYLTYMAFYLLPVFLLLWIGNGLLSKPRARPLSPRLATTLERLLWAWAVVGTTLVQLGLYADLSIMRLYGFHMNGFVWNVITTRGGIESLDVSKSAYGSFSVIVAGLLLLQIVLFVAARARRLPLLFTTPPRRRVLWMLVVTVLLLSLFERFTYCVSALVQRRDVLTVADAMPLYDGLHWRELGEFLGLEPHHDPDLVVGDDDAYLNYPHSPLVRAPGSRDWNIVWLVAESLRADSLDPQIMPATWDFSQRATRFERHFSAGNGTRMALFGMFYGLYGNSWFSVLRATRGPVLVELLLEGGWDIQAFTSAKFTYPEFDRTLWAQVPPERLHEGVPGDPGWKNDRANVDQLLASLDDRDKSKPFFRFMFFESPHARYLFPPESVIREPYIEDINYVEMDFSGDVTPVRNRYLNACHHLDSQYGRVLAGLEERGLLDSTIVVLTGDHGEEFMEHGRWGHNSDFTDEQTRTPLVIWVPGRGAESVPRMTSHLDLPATLASLLGVTTPEAEYTLGHDLFGPVVRERTVISAWDQMALVDARSKLVLPFLAGKLAGSALTGADDEAVPDEDAARAAMLPFITDTLADMGKFLH